MGDRQSARAEVPGGAVVGLRGMWAFGFCCVSVWGLGSAEALGHGWVRVLFLLVVGFHVCCAW